MTEWQNLPKPGSCWRLIKFEENDGPASVPSNAALAACAALWPVVQPLSVTLEMAARTLEYPYIELDIALPSDTWHLREQAPPAHVPVAARVQRSGHREEIVPQITPTALGRWLAEAHMQTLEPGYLPVLYSFQMYYTRARIIGEQAAAATLVFGPETYTVPIERRPDGRWAAGPLRDTMTNPPIAVSLENNDGRLTLTICAGWSPWAAPSSEEAALLADCLREIRSQGWGDDDR